MNLTFHIIFGVIALLFFLIEYLYRRNVYQLFFAGLVAVTFFIYLSTEQSFRMFLGIVELLILIGALYTLYRARKKQAAEAAVLEEQADGESK